MGFPELLIVIAALAVLIATLVVLVFIVVKLTKLFSDLEDRRR